MPAADREFVLCGQGTFIEADLGISPVQSTWFLAVLIFITLASGTAANHWIQAKIIVLFGGLVLAYRAFFRLAATGSNRAMVAFICEVLDAQETQAGLPQLPPRRQRAGLAVPGSLPDAAVANMTAL